MTPELEKIFSEHFERLCIIMTDLIASEREECAKIVETIDARLLTRQDVAAAIRARGNHAPTKI